MKTYNYAKKNVRYVFPHNNLRTHLQIVLTHLLVFFLPFSVSLCLYCHQSSSSFLWTDSLYVPHTPRDLLEVVASELLISMKE